MHRSRLAARRLSEIRRQGLFRSMTGADADGAYVRVGRKRLFNMSSNDYLALVDAHSIRTHQSASSSRLLSGNASEYATLEKSLATHRGKPSSLVFPTGYMANVGAICAVAQKGDVILSDELNHASVIDACRLSGAKTIVYRHNDMGDLESKIPRRTGTKFIVSEGIFSMDGDRADLRTIAKIAQRYNATSILDDAHADFVLENGSTDAAKIDMHTSSLSKALGSFGGYVAASSDITSLCVNTARPLIYTSALPRFVIAHALGRMRAAKKSRRARLARNVTQLHSELDSLGLGIDGAHSHIAPIIVNDERLAVRLSKRLYENGVLAQAIRYPTVRRGSARIRLSVTAWPTSAELGDALEKIRRACTALGVA